MTSTPDLIEALARDARPVRRLLPPMARFCLWVLLAATVVALIAVEHGLRPDLGEQLRHPAFLAGLLASAATGILAAVACLLASLPDRSRFWLLLPLPSLAVWLATIGYGCFTDWVSFDLDGMHMGEAIRCFATLLLVSAPLSAALFGMLRHVARLRPALVTLTAGLAVAGVASTALSLVHRLDATVMILIWNLGMAAALVALEGVLGRYVLQWLDRARSAG